MARTTMETRFREQVISDLSELKTSQKNVVEHLLKLNGSVAKHEEQLVQMKARESAQDAKDKTNTDWQNWLWAIVGAALTIVGKALMDSLLK